MACLVGQVALFAPSGVPYVARAIGPGPELLVYIPQARRGHPCSPAACQQRQRSPAWRLSPPFVRPLSAL
eukprot:2170274-Lingulodinium_polyedra.AAC.1